MNEYVRSYILSDVPRIPLEGSIDLTYRCNNNCRHCWLRIPPEAPEIRKETGTDEIKMLVDEARKLGCQRWTISGGEPMLRPDFVEIFDYITSRSVSYSINTNGTMISPEIAELMRRKGKKMVALYGASLEIHDHITRNIGSFQATMRGVQLLREAGAEFIVQLIPLRDNYHQYPEMVKLARSISPHFRVGAAWLYLSANGDPEKNAEIERQRLTPRDVIELDRSGLLYEESAEADSGHTSYAPRDDRLFASCISKRHEFHIDPYAQMSFCGFVKEPSLRYDLRKGSFQEAWDMFIPSLKDKVMGGNEYHNNCGSCNLRDNCRWCPVYSYLEHRRFSAKVNYLCEVARENHMFKEKWKMNNLRYFKCAGITIRVEADQPITDETFHPTFELFQMEGPEENSISIQLHTELPPLEGQDLGEVVCRKGEWVVRKKRDSWIYLNISRENKKIRKIAIFDQEHTSIRLYRNLFAECKGDNNQDHLYKDIIFLTHIVLAQILSYNRAYLLHSSGVILRGRAVLFLSHTDSGKSTLTEIILSRVGLEPLYDDLNIVSSWPDGYRVQDTWNNKDPQCFSSASVPLGAIMFVKQSKENRVIPLQDQMEVTKRLLKYVITPMGSSERWDEDLSNIKDMARKVPSFIVSFDLSGKIMSLIEDVCWWS